MKSTGNRIADRRTQLGLTRDQLAKRLKTTRIRVWRIETERTRLPMAELSVWAKALKVTPAELVA